MNGKVLKVVQYNLEFGGQDRFLNVFGCFKYKPNGNVYVIYSDVDTKYNIIYYGSGHMKGNSILVMQCRDAKDAEIIKEYIYKTTAKEALDNFEIFSLEAAEGVELIASDKIEVKPEVITSLVEVCLPKKEESPEEQAPTKKKKKSSKGILLLLLLMIIGGALYFYITSLPDKDAIVKKITCEKNYSHNTLNATVNEVNTYNFNLQDNLEDVDVVMTYQFNESDYQDFILKGTYYKYLPDDDQTGGYKLDDTNYVFKIMMKEEIDTSYTKPTTYEEVFSYYKSEGYTCTEEIVE